MAIVSSVTNKQKILELVNQFMRDPVKIDGDETYLRFLLSLCKNLSKHLVEKVNVTSFFCLEKKPTILYRCRARKMEI